MINPKPYLVYNNLKEILMKRIILFTFLLILFSTYHISLAQNDYQEWLKKEREKFNFFVEEEDKKFADFLRKQWIEVELDKGLKSFTVPKPFKPLEFKEGVIKENKEIKVIPSKNLDVKPSSKEKNEIKSNIKKEDEKPEIEKIYNERNFETQKPSSKLSLLEVDFYGNNIQYSYDEEVRVKLKGKINKETIADYWLDLSSTNYKGLLKQFLDYKSKMKLNDWGYLWLINNLSEKLYGDISNEKILFTWFMLIKSSYMARVGYNEKTVVLLIASKNKIYDVPYLMLKDNPYRFYYISFDEKNLSEGGQIYTYNGEHSASEKVFDLNLIDYPTINDTLGQRTVQFNYKGQEVTIPIIYNVSIVKFFKQYPHTEYSIYFSTGMSDQAKNNLLKSIKPYIENKSEIDAVNFLLHFVQKATNYKSDKEQFGVEKPLFPEESLFYEFSDCEDRCILFSYLVSNLLGLKVVALDFPNHVATAVKFNDNIKGDFIIYKGSKFVICDPTYFGADVGVCIPAYKNAEAKIIEY